MCGIVGIIQPGWSGESWQTRLTAMTDSLRHRGPDDAGIWFDREVGVGLGHRRLAILDVSERGHQPMASADGRLQLSFNGEIYNFRDLRRQLEDKGHGFATETDTEVLLAGFREWGVRGALERANGMFALCLWDREERAFYLARDRMGEKPLYFGRAGRGLVAASELKAFHHHPDFDATIDRDVLSLLFRYGYVPAPYSIYRGVEKVEPGELVRFTDTGSGIEVTDRSRYWSVVEAMHRGTRSPLDESPEEMAARVHDVARKAVGLRMISDVPLGAFLSGGIDSSLVVALMQDQARGPVKTFTIGFDAEGFDESQHARRVAEHLGTDHHELRVAPATAREVIPRLPRLYDEPFADSSQIPTFLVSELSRRTVTVALSGDGGDELFAGYKRYRLASRLWNRLRWVPRLARQATGALLLRTPPAALDLAFGWAEDRLAAYGRRGRVSHKLKMLAAIQAVPDRASLYVHLMSKWRPSDGLVPGAEEPLTALVRVASEAGRSVGYHDQMMLTDMVSYLPDDILVKLDRASMAVSLESRVPLLDPEFVELSWRVPAAVKCLDGNGKWPLREALARHLPRPYFERTKMGFGIPLASWLRGPLRSWAGDLLSPDVLAAQGYLDPEPVQRVWREHQNGERNWHDLLWSVIMFQAWLQEYHR